MDKSKISHFFEVAIMKTRALNLIWSRLTPTMSRYFHSVDLERSFSTQYSGGEIVLLRNPVEDSVLCFIKPDADLSYQQIGEDDDPTLLRLYNVVYSQFPSIDSFVEQFIQDF